jgi:hypothetical protein
MKKSNISTAEVFKKYIFFIEHFQAGMHGTKYFAMQPDPVIIRNVGLAIVYFYFYFTFI